ncbi:MAG: OpgC family protein [Gemmatimonas sp.]
MQPTIKANLAAHGRDLRIDFARGLANWFMLLDHIPHNVVNLFTMRNFGFCGAIDLFALVSGYGVAILYGKMTLERGFIVAATRIVKRSWQLYAAHLVLFVIYINAIGWAAARYAAPAILQEYHIVGILNDPVRVLMHGLLLESRPLNLDVLQMAIVLLLFFPVALAGLMRWPNLTILGSIALYVVARHFGWGLPAFPAGSPYLNPFAWQLLFVLGAWFALSGGKWVRALQELWLVRAVALAYLVFALFIMIAAAHPAIAALVPDALIKSFIPVDRDNLGPARVLHILSIVLLFTWAVPADWKGFDHKLMQPVLKCGEEWLASFCVGVFLSLAGYIVLITSPNSYLLQVLVSAAGLVLMTAVAYYVSWSKQQDRVPRLSPARAKQDHATADR